MLPKWIKSSLITGFYLWFSSLKIRIGGSKAEDTYCGTIHSFAGIALVLPGYIKFGIPFKVLNAQLMVQLI